MSKTAIGQVQLTALEARGLRMAVIFGMPDPVPDEIASAVEKLKAIEAGAQEDTRRCERKCCGHPASVHSTGIPERGVFMCEVEGCECPGWIYGEGLADREATQ